MGKLFGTDGVRGLANAQLDGMLAFKLGQAGAYVLTREKHRPKILIGRDTRLSGDMLEAAIVAGICSVGAEAVVAGVLPTPAVAYLTRHYGADAGVVISASHNSMEYNGIKFFDYRGYKLPDELEERIENIIFDNTEALPVPVGIEIGRRVRARDVTRDYIDFLASAVNGSSLCGVKAVVDCANGAAYEVAPKVLSKLGVQVIPIHDDPDGININQHCGSTHPERLMSHVLETGADIGLAFDGDADRLILVDEHGKLVDGDQIMAICGISMHSRGVLHKNTVVTTVMSNLGLDLALKKEGCNIVKTKVGDRYVLEEMLAQGYNFGGEQSGHLIFLDHNTTGDGILTALQIMSIMKGSNKSLSTLSSVMAKLPQVLANAKVNDDKKAALSDDPVIQQEIKNIESKFMENGRVLIRASGTEPLIRVMIEGPDQTTVERYAYQLARLIEQRLG